VCVKIISQLFKLTSNFNQDGLLISLRGDAILPNDC
jgi:hypothetical protein